MILLFLYKLFSSNLSKISRKLVDIQDSRDIFHRRAFDMNLFWIKIGSRIPQVCSRRFASKTQWSILFLKFKIYFFFQTCHSSINKCVEIRHENITSYSHSKFTSEKHVEAVNDSYKPTYYFYPTSTNQEAFIFWFSIMSSLRRCIFSLYKQLCLDAFDGPVILVSNMDQISLYTFTEYHFHAGLWKGSCMYKCFVTFVYQFSRYIHVACIRRRWLSCYLWSIQSNPRDSELFLRFYCLAICG